MPCCEYAGANHDTAHSCVAIIVHLWYVLSDKARKLQGNLEVRPQAKLVVCRGAGFNRPTNQMIQQLPSLYILAIVT